MRTRRTDPKPREKPSVAANGGVDRFLFRLCVTGMTPRSSAAILNIRNLCEAYLPGRYDLEVIDLYQHPELARRHQILATPTLIKEHPGPVCRLFGSLSDQARTLRHLGIVPATV